MDTNTKLFSALMIPLLLAGCVKELEERGEEDLQDEEMQEVVFHAGWAPETKTVLQEDGSVWWSPGDSISFFPQWWLEEGGYYYTKHSKIVANNTVDAEATDFICRFNPMYPDEIDHFVKAVSYIAIYPYNSENMVILPNHFGITIPTVQTAVAGSFDKKAFVSYAIAENNQLLFKNLCGGVKFSVSQEGIKEVSFRYAKPSDYHVIDCMSGHFYLTDLEDSTLNGASGLSEVIVRAPGDTYFEVGKYYYAVMAPSKNEQPLFVTYKKDTEKATYWTPGSTQIKRSVFKRLYAKDKGLTFKPIRDGALMKSVLPGDMYTAGSFKNITEVYFHPSSDRVTDTNLGTDEAPVYFELDGTVVNYYTPKECFDLRNVTYCMFLGWTALTKVDFSGVDTSEATDFISFFSGCKSLKTLDNLDCLDVSAAISLNNMFQSCTKLVSLDLSSFNTGNVTDMSGMFELCRSLRELNLSSFDTRNCSDMGGMFSGCTSLQKLDLANFDMSSVTDVSGMCNGLSLKVKQCIVRTSDSVWDQMCSEAAKMPSASKNDYVKHIAPGEEFPALEDKFADLYKSTDYSKDYTYRLVHSATKGKGIDLVLMGDAYSDRLIEDGTYDSDMERVIDHIFSEEPLHSLKDYFNIYITYAVSENETPDGVTAFSLVFQDSSSHIDRAQDNTLDDYMRATLPDYGHEFASGKPVPYIIVVSNCQRHAGVTEFWSSGSTVVLMTLENSDTELHAVACHEFGHALGKLGDEYDQVGGTFYDTYTFNDESAKGFWPNLDITNDTNSVKWSRFLSDERYSGQGLGVFEGGYANYAYGIWRSTENSIMNDAVTGFNAPSREALYKVVNTLADDSFVYDYETFVAFDQKAMSSSTTSVKPLNYVERRAQRCAPPVFVKTKLNSGGASTTIVPR